MSDKTKTFTRVKVKESMEVGTTITVPTLISTSSLVGPAYVSGTETVKTVDTTGSNNTYSTIAAALTALSKESGDIGVIQLTEGQSYTLTDLDFSQCQRNFKKVIVRGTRTSVTNTTVASLSTGGPGKAGTAWQVPTVSDTLVNLAHANTICYNSTIDRYFVIDTNNTTSISPASFIPDPSNYHNYQDFFGDEDRAGFAVSDSLVLFTPSPTINVSSLCTLSSIPGGEIHFVELNFNLTDGCNIFSEKRLHFEGCIIVRDDVNSSSNNLVFGPITAPVTFSGTYSSNGADDSGIVTTPPKMTDESLIILNSKLTGGSLGDSDFDSGPLNIVVVGSKLQLYFYVNYTTARCFSSYIECDGNVFSDHSILTFKNCTLSGTTTVSFSTSTAQIEYCDILDTLSMTLHSKVRLFNSDITTSSTGISVQSGSQLEISSLVNVTTTSNYGIDIYTNGVVTCGNIPPVVNGSTSAVYRLRNGSKLAFVSSTATNLTNTGNGIELYSGSSCTAVTTPYTGTFSSGAGTAVKVGDNAVTSFATIVTGLAANVNDYGTASPQMCFMVIG